MTVFAEPRFATGERELTTYISTDVERLVVESFFSNQRQTAAGNLETHEALREVKKYVPVTGNRGYSYDMTIVRFYEEIISELQRELARHKDMLARLIAARTTEAEETVYSQGQPTLLPPEIAQKLTGRTKPGLPVVGYEI